MKQEYVQPQYRNDFARHMNKQPSQLERKAAVGAAALVGAAAATSLADLVTYQEVSPGAYDMTLTNTNSFDNVTHLTLDYSSINPNYVGSFVLGTPSFEGGDRTWEYQSQTSSQLDFIPQGNETAQYLRPGEWVTFRINQPTNNLIGTAPANGIATTTASGNMESPFNAPSYAIPEPSTAYLVGIGLAAAGLRAFLRKRFSRRQ